MLRKQNLTFTKDDVDTIIKLMDVELDDSFVKDLRTNYENSNAEAVLNGDIINFMKEYLRIKR